MASTLPTQTLYDTLRTTKEALDLLHDSVQAMQAAVDLSRQALADARQIVATADDRLGKVNVPLPA